jgi:Ca2+-transporting ATPase
MSYERTPPLPPSGAVNDYQKDLKFRKLNAQKDVIEVKVIRGGDTVLVKNSDVVVGDLLVLDTGDKIVADGVMVQSFGLVVDEASLTGESDPIKKSEDDPWCRSGTQVGLGSRC